MNTNDKKTNFSGKQSQHTSTLLKLSSHSHKNILGSIVSPQQIRLELKKPAKILMVLTFDLVDWCQWEDNDKKNEIKAIMAGLKTLQIGHQIPTRFKHLRTRSVNGDKYFIELITEICDVTAINKQIIAEIEQHLRNSDFILPEAEINRLLCQLNKIRKL